MARRAAGFIALVISAVGLWAVATPAGASSSSATRVLEQGVLSNMNAFRREHGLAPLRLSSGLTAAARKHSSDMAARGYFSHTSVGGTSFDRRIAHFYPMGSRHYWSVGENLLWSSPDVDAARAVDMWINSPEHRKNMLTVRWKEIGLAAVHVPSAPGTFGGREVTIVTADFGVRR
jgi:uncharacterized protein YkwD